VRTDWLGPGIYFWIDSPERGLNWAREQAARNPRRIKNPDVIGAFIYPSPCHEARLTASLKLEQSLASPTTGLPVRQRGRDFGRTKIIFR